ncbi:YadA family autotransporter adhesin [Sphingopyxis sp. 550A]
MDKLGSDVIDSIEQGDAQTLADAKAYADQGDARVEAIANDARAVADAALENGKYLKVNGTGDVPLANGVDAVAIGSGSVADSDQSVAMGAGAQARGGKAVSIGAQNVATGNGAVAIGDPNNATGTGAVAVGADNTATGDGAVAIGNANTATGNGAIALGNGASATADNSIALGNSAVADEANTVSVGSAGATRRITNVSAGVAPTDVVNMSQLTGLTNNVNAIRGRVDILESRVDQQSFDLRRIDRMAGRGVAIATALASIPPLSGDKNVGIGFGTGTYDGRFAFSFALIARAGDSAQFRVNAGTAGNGKIAAGAGATFGF